MTGRQKILKAIYPVVMWFSHFKKNKLETLQNSTVTAPVSFYGLQCKKNDGTGLDLTAFKGKKILIVNTASDCGFTDQYAELEALYRRYPGKLEILAFPANDFKQQEQGDDASIAAFCKKNYGVSFTMMAKSIVVPGREQNAVFNWLTDPSQNGWNSKAPGWNFCKYLVNEKGMLTHYFATTVSPLSGTVTRAIDQE